TLVVAMMKNWIELNVAQFEVSDFISGFRCRSCILIGNSSAEAFIVGSSQNNQNTLAHKIICFLLRSVSGRADDLQFVHDLHSFTRGLPCVISPIDRTEVRN